MIWDSIKRVLTIPIEQIHDIKGYTYTFRREGWIYEWEYPIGFCRFVGDEMEKVEVYIPKDKTVRLRVIGKPAFIDIPIEELFARL